MWNKRGSGVRGASLSEQKVSSTVTAGALLDRLSLSLCISSLLRAAVEEDVLGFGVELASSTIELPAEELNKRNRSCSLRLSYM